LDCISDEIEGEFDIYLKLPSYKKLIFWGNRPLEKIIILDLLELTLSFQMLQYSQKIFSCNCRSDAESENKTSGIKSRVLYNGEMSEYFPCNIGIRQGENL
jgi:hypothetical protein